MKSSKQKSHRSRFWIQFGLICYAIFALFPLIWVGLMSLKSYVDIISPTPKFIFSPSLENYKAILFGVQSAQYETSRTNFLLYFKNSCIVTICAVSLSLLVGVPAAYALARFRFRFKEDIAFTFLSFRFAPEIAIIIPIYVLYQKLQLYNTYIGLILVYQLITLPLIVWIIRGYFEDISVEIEQAAKLDGYSWWGVFTKIAIPLVKPGLASTAILAFIFAWNNFIFGLILGAKETFPTTVGTLGFISYESVLWGQMAAATVITILPPLILAIFIQKYLVRGLTLGAVRG
ncbi:MAG: carbohydrate ABC transporter permease [bacterium]